MTVRGLRRDEPGEIFRSEPIALHYSRSEVLGALYYWSTGTSGVMRAHIAAATATKFYADPMAEDGGTCVACHTVSRDGRRLSAGYDGERLRVVTIPDRSLLIPAVAADDDRCGQARATVGHLHPDGTRCSTRTRARSRCSTRTRPTVAEVALPSALRHAPDWSPDGRHVAVA